MADQFLHETSTSSPVQLANQGPSMPDNNEEIWCNDEYLQGNSDEGLVKESELEWEWERRQGRFHAIGYRDGLGAGKEASAQEGFNIGFKQSVVTGYEWGLVKGITSALSSLPDYLKEKLIGTVEKKERLQIMHESVQSISTDDALKSFHMGMLVGELPHTDLELISAIGGVSSCTDLSRLHKELEDFLSQTPTITCRLSLHSLF